MVLRVVTPAGQVAEIEDNQRDAALAQGYRLATPADEAQLKERQKYSDSPGTAFLLGAARGAMPIPGMFDYGARKLGYGKEVGGYLKYNPEASLVGEIGGTFNPLSFTGLVTKGESIAAKYAAKYGAGLGTHIASGALREGIIGGGFGYSGHVAAENAAHPEGDLDLAGEKAFKHTMSGVAFGGITGGALAGIGGLVGMAGRGAKEGVKKLGGRVAEIDKTSFWDVLVDKYGSALESVTPGAKARLMELTSHEGMKRVQQYLDREAIAESAVPRSFDLVDSVLMGLDDLEGQLIGTMKRKHWAPLLKDVPENGKLAELAVKVETAIDNIIDNPNTRGAVVKEVSSFWDDIGEMLLNNQNGSVVDQFMAGDAIKRELQDFWEILGRRAEKSHKFRNAYEVIGALRKDAQLMLEDEAWGAAGRAQQLINKSWSEQIPSGTNFLGTFGRKEAAKGFPTGRNRLDKARWDRHLGEGLTDERLAQTRYLKEFFESAPEFLKQVKDNIPTLRGKVEKIESSMNEAYGEYQKLFDIAAVSGIMDQLSTGAIQFPKSPFIRRFHGVPVWQMTAIGGFLAGAPGAAGGLALDVMSKPAEVVQAAARVRTYLDKGSKVVAENADKAAAASNIGAKALAQGAKAYGKFNKLRTRAGVMLAVNQGTLLGEDKEERTDFRKVSERLRTQVPAEFRQDVKSMVGAELPTVSESAGDTADRYQAWLNSQLPRTEHSGGGVLVGRRSVSKTEKRRFMRQLEALNDPDKVAIAAISGGHVNGLVVRALAQVYPRWYQELRSNIVDMLIAMDSEDKKLSYRRRLSISRFLQIRPDNTFDRLYLQTMKEYYNPAISNKKNPRQSPTSGAKSKRKNDDAFDLRSGSERAAEGIK